ncbi:hypothetical protein IMY05_010G0127600 [Salix suchowensis]|nr:hypothetical protein IMY05_010G0127600 [Salix suchowensis]
MENCNTQSLKKKKTERDIQRERGGGLKGEGQAANPKKEEIHKNRIRGKRKSAYLHFAGQISQNYIIVITPVSSWCHVFFGGGIRRFFPGRQAAFSLESILRSKVHQLQQVYLQVPLPSHMSKHLLAEVC